MAKEMNTDTLMKKLKTVSNTQDSIPMLSLWIIHHKSHHKKIVEAWLDMLKKSKNQHRLTLLYLCNDVVQNCVRKKAPIYKDSFSDVLAEAVTHLRDSSIKGNVQRVVKIWSKRAIYDTDFTDQLLAALITNRAPEKLRNKLLIEYKTSNLIDEIKKFKVIEDGIEFDQKRLKAIRMDVSNTDAIRKLKDKIGGEKFSSDFEDSATQLETFLTRYEKYIEERKGLLDLLDHGTVYYHAQYHEAKIVVNAYKSFETRVQKMKNGVESVKSKFSPLPQEKQLDNSGEDMDVSDDDKISEKKSIIFASEVKPKKERNSEKSNLHSEDATNVLKLLATGLESLKSSNAAESLKKVVSGLVSRPGMRGASSFNTNSDSSVKENSKGSLTVVKSINENGGNKSRFISTLPSPPAGVESPPSPTGSPELNISSPPRLQSLDSRLADLFNEDGNQEGNRQTAEESDSESDSGLISRAGLTINNKKESVLPGLGDLDQIKKSSAAKAVETRSETKESGKSGPDEITKPVVKTAQSDVIVTSQVTASTAVSSFYSTSNQTIPVIGGLSRVAPPMLDGSSTPTLDEEPYDSSSLSRPSFMSAQPTSATIPGFGGDALSFLSKLMGNPSKTVDVVKTDSYSISSSVAPPPSNAATIAASTAFGGFTPPVWPPSNTQVISTSVSSRIFSSPPPLPTLPPPPVFSWPPNPDPSLPPPPWSLAAPQISQPATDTPQLSSPVLAKANIETNSLTPPHPSLPPNPIPPPQPPISFLNEPPVKKGKWDLDTDYRSMNMALPSQSQFENTSKLVDSDVRNNLITLSSASNDDRRPNHKESSIVSPNRAMTRDNDSIPVRRSYSEGNHPGFSSATSAPRYYDEHGRSIDVPEVSAIHRRIEEARLKSSLDVRRSEPKNRHDQMFKNHYVPSEPPSRLPEPENSFRPPISPRMRLPAPRRRSVSEMANIEMEMIRSEKRREAELLRDVALLDEIDRMVPPSRSWTHHRPRFSPHRPPAPRPRMVRHAHIRGPRPPQPRMRY